MRTYTVVLWHPNWMQDGSGYHTYTHVCQAPTAKRAVGLAKQAASSDNGDEDPTSFGVLAVMRGEVRFVEGL